MDVYKLVQHLEESQWIGRQDNAVNLNTPILTREVLQHVPIDKSKPYTTSSGSTGQPVTVQKTYAQKVWYQATNIRELLWRKWDTSLKLALVNPNFTKEEVIPWSINNYVFPRVGLCYMHPAKGDIQAWIDRIKPDYLHAYPSIIQNLDISKLKDVKSTGERGGTAYSCEEVGTIGITCPDNPDVYHVMENIIVEIDDDGNILVTDLTHPYLKRYKLGDKGEFGECSCGRKLQTLKKDVVGRIRNMVTYPNGIKAWPKFGTISIRETEPGVKRIQAIQSSVNDIVIKVQGEITNENHTKKLIQKSLEYDFNITFEYVNEFPVGKFEEFKSLI